MRIVSPIENISEFGLIKSHVLQFIQYVSHEDND